MSELTVDDIMWAPPLAGSIVIRPCGPLALMGLAPFWLIYDRGRPRWIRHTLHDAHQCVLNLLISQRRR